MRCFGSGSERLNSHYFLLLSWGIPEEDAERCKEDVDYSDNGHQPGEADVLCDGASDGRTWKHKAQRGGSEQRAGWHTSVH